MVVTLDVRDVEPLEALGCSGRDLDPPSVLSRYGRFVVARLEDMAAMPACVYSHRGRKHSLERQLGQPVGKANVWILQGTSMPSC